MLRHHTLLLILATVLLGASLAQAQPDLTYTSSTAWDYPLVPRDSIGSGPGEWQQITPTLPGNLPSTYYSSNGINSGTLPTEVNLWAWYLVDDEFLDSLFWAPGIAPGTRFISTYEGPFEIRGGRHTLEFRIDPANDIAELDETNNRWGHPFIWTPLDLTTAVVTRPAPPDRTGGWDSVVDGSPLFFNCDGLRMPTTSFWNAVVLWSDDPAADYDVRLHDPSVGSEDGFAGWLAWSDRIGPVLDAVIQNDNTAPGTAFDAATIEYGGTGDYQAVHVASVEQEFGTTFDVTLGENEFLTLQEFFVASDELGFVSMFVDIDPAEGPVAALFLQDEFTFGGLLDYDDIGFSDPFGRAHIGAEITDSGYHCLVVYREPMQSTGPLNMTITLGPTPPDFRPVQPAGWHSPLVPRPTADGTMSSVPLPTELSGNTPTTYYNIAVENFSPMTIPPGATVNIGLSVDVIDWIGYGGPIGAFGRNLRNNFFADPIKLVRGGRHTVAMDIDYADQWPEISENNNMYAEQYAWSPLNLPVGSAVTREAPPDRLADRDVVIASGNPFFDNCDGLRLPDTAPPVGEDRYWQAVAVAPGLTSEVDLRLHEVGTGVQDAFGAGLLYSFWQQDRSNFVLVNFNQVAYGPYDVGAIRWNGVGDYSAASSASTYLGADPVGSFGPFGLNPGDIVNLHEIYLEPGFYAFQLENDSGNVDWGFALYPHDQPFLGKMDSLPGSTAYLNGPGGDEFINVEIIEENYYCLAVWKEHRTDVGDVGTYILRGILGTTAADDTEQLPVKTALSGVYPNPFNPQTTVAFELARSGRVEIGVYDVQGSLVRTLVSGSYAAGQHEVIWNGRDDSGREVSSGTYFARLDAGPVRTMQKMTLLK